MNWRRGLLLAGINIALVLPMISVLAVRDAQLLRDWNQRSATDETHWMPSYVEYSQAPVEVVRVQEEQTVGFDSCELWSRIPVQVAVVQFGNLPAAILTQWRADCPPKWSVAAKLGVKVARRLSDENFIAMRRVDLALCLFISAQWFFMGGFPLIESRRWWSEPGAFITVCTAIGSGIALIPIVEELGRLPVLLALIAWLWWFVLLLWKIVYLAWRSTLASPRRLSN